MNGSVPGGGALDQALNAWLTCYFSGVLLLGLLECLLRLGWGLQLSVHLDLLCHHLHLLVHWAVNARVAHVTVFHLIVDLLVIDVHFHSWLPTVRLHVWSLRVSWPYDLFRLVRIHVVRCKRFVWIHDLLLGHRLLGGCLLWVLSQRTLRWLTRLDGSWGLVLESVECASSWLLFINDVQSLLPSNYMSAWCWNRGVYIGYSVTLSDGIHYNCSLSSWVRVSVNSLVGILQVLDTFVSYFSFNATLDHLSLERSVWLFQEIWKRLLFASLWGLGRILTVSSDSHLLYTSFLTWKLLAAMSWWLDDGTSSTNSLLLTFGAWSSRILSQWGWSVKVIHANISLALCRLHWHYRLGFYLVLFSFLLCFLSFFFLLGCLFSLFDGYSCKFSFLLSFFLSPLFLSFFFLESFSLPLFLNLLAAALQLILKFCDLIFSVDFEIFHFFFGYF